MCLESFIKLLRVSEDGKAVLVVGEDDTQLGHETFRSTRIKQAFSPFVPRQPDYHEPDTSINRGFIMREG